MDGKLFGELHEQEEMAKLNSFDYIISNLQSQVDELKETITDQVKIIDEVSNHLLDANKKLAVYKAGFLDLKTMINNCHETESPCDCCEASSECDGGQLDCIDMIQKHFLKGE